MSPFNHHLAVTDTEGGKQRPVLNGVMEEGWGGGEGRKMRLMMLKLAPCEKVTDDLMLVCNSP